jgi:hypothetical protein
MRRLLLLLPAALFLFACGSPKAGDKCSTNGFLCQDGANALECKLGSWVQLPCRGSSGCTKSGDTVQCDMTADLEGDNCASSAEGKGLCTADGTATLECRDGKLVKTNTCRTCTVQNDQVVCTPP